MQWLCSRLHRSRSSYRRWKGFLRRRLRRSCTQRTLGQGTKSRVGASCSPLWSVSDAFAWLLSTKMPRSRLLRRSIQENTGTPLDSAAPYVLANICRSGKPAGSVRMELPQLLRVAAKEKAKNPAKTSGSPFPSPYAAGKGRTVWYPTSEGASLVRVKSVWTGEPSNLRACVLGLDKAVSLRNFLVSYTK